MKILVVGGAGFVGTRLVPQLSQAGHKVTVLDLGLFPRGWTYLQSLRPEITVLQGDVRDVVRVQEAVRGNEVVINLAAMSNDPSAELRPDLTREINLSATLALIDESAKAGCRRFLNVSSASVYGIQPDSVEVTEEIQPIPQTLYAKFKLETELYALSRHKPDFEVISVRPGTLSGWSPRGRLDLTVNLFVYQALAHGRLSILGGKQQRPNLHINDLVRMLVNFLVAPTSVYGETYNLNENNYTVEEIARTVSEMVSTVNGRNIPLSYTPSPDNRSYRLSASRARKLLEFQPEATLRDAVSDVQNGILGVGLSVAGTAEFRNIERLKELRW